MSPFDLRLHILFLTIPQLNLRLVNRSGLDDSSLAPQIPHFGSGHSSFEWQEGRQVWQNKIMYTEISDDQVRDKWTRISVTTLAGPDGIHTRLQRQTCEGLARHFKTLWTFHQQWPFIRSPVWLFSREILGYSITETLWWSWGNSDGWEWLKVMALNLPWPPKDVQTINSPVYSWSTQHYITYLHVFFAKDRLVGLVVKASASRAEGPGSRIPLAPGFFRGRVIPVT